MEEILHDIIMAIAADINSIRMEKQSSALTSLRSHHSSFLKGNFSQVALCYFKLQRDILGVDVQPPHFR